MVAIDTWMDCAIVIYFLVCGVYLGSMYHSHNYNPEEGLVDDSKWAGRYYTQSGIIEFKTKGVSHDQVLYVTHHEVAHYLWYEMLPRRFRDRYEGVYDRSKVFVTNYSQKSVEEDFAENFAKAMSCELKVNRLPSDRRGLLVEASRYW